jgi:hypothetical protein
MGDEAPEEQHDPADNSRRHKIFRVHVFPFPFLKLQVVQLGSLDVRTKDNTEKTIKVLGARGETSQSVR